MSTRGRRWLRTGLTLPAAAVGVVLFLALTADPLEAARRRVPLGGDEATVVRAIGRPPDSVMGRPGAPPRTRPGRGSGSSATSPCSCCSMRMAGP